MSFPRALVPFDASFPEGYLPPVQYVSDLLDVPNKADREAESWIALHGQRLANRRMAIVLTTVMLCMIFTRYYGSAGRLNYWVDLLQAVGLDEWAKGMNYWVHQHPNRKFNGRMFWAVGRIVGYVVFPALVIKFVLRDSVRNYGLRIKGILPDAKVYAVMLAIIMPLVVMVSFSPAFQRKYPFYNLAVDEPWWPNFIMWELLYAMQFAALEFFFRGFMVHGTKQRLGYASVWVMMVPYMMIHFGKPMPECVGSIIAGFALGMLSLKSNSVWWGVAIHVAVAWTMDLLSLWQRGILVL